MDEMRLLTSCGEKLAAHIEPAEVRLVTMQSDAYTWIHTTEVAHLFSKDLADHGVTAYRRLYQEVGQSFHAVTFTNKATVVGQASSAPYVSSCGPPTHNISTAQLEKMRRKDLIQYVSCMGQQLSQMEEKAAVEAAAMVRMQQDAETLQHDNERLAQEVRQQSEDARYHRNFYYKLLESTCQLNSSVEEIQQDYMRTIDISMFPKDEFLIF
ncbi:uncharacterized protein NECHADRAFT_88462 [Fusarium vanettenii 77-13-4]|uniref:Uncharacterized protein n=1 Tax=Fusarium vanettenii (strain ATCC MYA-4622 / CBS 123669 / FGSC 9596 / NRRL 45880 / 77-13-4) TaxID=660122 RepID=C7ZBK8_FUSV7|nr:uncharacterized protein NECHADRAFT_88462 [Fusarium vanettenii 77-13-4]EEU38588.1 predicted protein [Fusarium vanettenii 77-13-4]